jgi:hypothetical protein
MYPFLGQSLPTIFENRLVIHKYTFSPFVLLLALKMKKDLSEIAGWSDQERHGSGDWMFFWPFFIYSFSSGVLGLLVALAHAYFLTFSKL